jgi:hypothetical protein
MDYDMGERDDARSETGNLKWLLVLYTLLKGMPL